ncbi:OFA family MFS transporter [Thalassotalea sp. G20_0]|uniref:L-lactate MFS transporter n=1 Tax=Thalassotalea sp. G20_0 TaxID=2821093 RepID=UPI001ADB834C|nr:OFA family MFS transporter [Thalassotalea sp. G20_0]MBO9493938.1 OFA family MFS transporter [Thalassotalea sp. G20_0]
MATGTNRGWVVVTAGLAINLMFGSLYTWSIFSENFINTQGWTASQASTPYAAAIAAFALVMLVGGKLQDRLGPRVVITIAGLCTAAGMFLCSAMPTETGVILGFGVLNGAGIGLGYSATAPAAVKWFKPEQKGLIVGLVVTGFGLAPLYAAPLAKYLIAEYGLFASFNILAVFFGSVIVTGAQFMSVPETTTSMATADKKAKETPVVADGPETGEYNWKQMIRTPQFAMLWLMFLAGSMTGLMMIGHIGNIAKLQLSDTFNITLLVQAFSVANALGRPGAGLISDRIGRARTMSILYTLQGAVLLMFGGFDTFSMILMGSLVITFGYGAMLAVFPSATADFFGTRNLGFNYAILFSAWGVAGMAGPKLAGYLLDTTGGYESTFMICAGVSFAAAAIGLMVKPPKKAADFAGVQVAQAA